MANSPRGATPDIAAAVSSRPISRRRAPHTAEAIRRQRWGKMWGDILSRAAKEARK